MGAALASTKIHEAIIKGREVQKIPMQKICYECLMDCRFSNSLAGTVERRLNNSFNPYLVDCSNFVRLEDAFGILRGCRVSVATRVLKGWVNGWATSHRYHESVLLPCVFGCSCCADSLDHYLVCSHLLAIWSFFIDGTSAEPLVRWGLMHTTKLQCEIIACIFSGYHAIRKELRVHSSLLHNDMSILPSSILRRAWSVFAESFRVEARELGVPHRQFSLPDFLFSIT